MAFFRLPVLVAFINEYILMIVFLYAEIMLDVIRVRIHTLSLDVTRFLDKISHKVSTWLSLQFRYFVRDWEREGEGIWKWLHMHG